MLSTKQIEKLLKITTDPKQYIIAKNLSTFIKSDVWNKFEFPTKLQNDATHEVISGFVRCFDCFTTLSFEGSTKYMIKHKCFIPAAAHPEQVVHQGLMDKYLPKNLLFKNKIKNR
ncbi:unnamed protein product [Rotaria magnacalcarata]|uniref:Uncharacterized protein n=1 Tax=Rotaria magnacalcarata TaxID=392030 RepID=A0A816T0K5_9BILA|nr:unnamed protein product [Rotaria magnacalcarata]CAF1538048.1 unnamed protein product [Rotaria magnacalcarata]CAF1929263.1 unnamed protein product [Rotaria magnacalcarata]CAF2090354.1 unnamed protein product [Rotaria magnacalcarata]CAF3921587.1 unnamed protein product [Rotaria magnacalcarata]